MAAMLRDSEERFLAVFEHSDMGIALVEPDGRFRQANPAWLAMTGYLATDLKFLTMDAITHPEERADYAEELRRLWDGEVLAVQTERRYLHKGGGTLWVHLTLSLIQPDDGHPPYLITQASSRSAQKRAEASAREQEQLYRLVAENASDLIALHTPEGRYLYVSPSAERMLGYTPEELLCSPAYARLHPDDIAGIRRSNDQVLRGNAQLIQYRIRRKSGEYVWFETFTSPVHAEDGRVVQLQTCSRDITARIQAEEALRESEQRYRALFENSMDAVLVARPEDGAISVVVRDITQRRRDEEKLSRYAQELRRSNQELQSLIQNMAEGVLAVDEQPRLLVVNPAAARLLGLPVAFLGQEAREPLLPGALVQALQRARAGGQAAMATFALGDLELRVHAAPLTAGGAVALLQDVTAEIQLQRMRESFLADASHELRGPLASLTAVMEALRDGVIPPGGQPRYVEQALAELRRLRRLVDDLLELSKIDHGMVLIHPAEFDLHLLCLELVDRWQHRCVSLGIELASDCPSIRVYADRDRVQQILTNLIHNAVRFTPKGGRIGISARPAGEQVRIAIADTGPGIEAQHLPFIWDRFYRVDSARPRSGEGGTGLGLSIVRQLVGWLGGEVDVDSAPGKGSTFGFTLPATPQGAGATRETSAGSA